MFTPRDPNFDDLALNPILFPFPQILAYLAVAALLLLIVLRVITVWDRDRTIVALATEIWGINITFVIQGGPFIAPGRAFESPI